MQKINQFVKMKKNKGITLIALVITIIVLLILVAVSISTLTGENGILTRANGAKQKNEIEEAKEKAKLDIIDWQADQLKKREDAILTDSRIKDILTKKVYVGAAKESSFTTVNGGYEIPYSELYSTPPKVETAIPGEIVTGSNKEYTKNGTVIIPVGFAIVPGLDDVSQGLVISDVANDTENIGNQFVWVPVENIDDFYTIPGYCEGYLDNMSDYVEPYTNGYVTEVSEYEDMKQSVKNNHGFYIGRFETGKDADENVVVKKNMPVYNNIKWGKSMTDETGGAVELAKNFATNKEYTSVTSTLCYGVQWDATMQFFDSNYKDSACDWQTYVFDSYGKGNYSLGQSGLVNTGSDDDYAMKNIYDMAGNVAEWTMEVYNTEYRVLRGGSYCNSGNVGPASSRDGGKPSDCIDTRGFRITLYLV